MRSASFSFGALQALQQQLGLVHGSGHARFLSAVSGGSYIAAAMLMSLGGTLGTPSRRVPGRSWALRVADGAVALGRDGHPEYADARAADGRESLWARPCRSSATSPAPG